MKHIFFFCLFALFPGVLFAQDMLDFEPVFEDGEIIEERFILRAPTQADTIQAQAKDDAEFDLEPPALQQEPCGTDCYMGTMRTVKRNNCTHSVFDYPRSVKVGDCEFGKRMLVTQCSNGDLYYQFPATSTRRPGDGVWRDHSWTKAGRDRHVLKIISSHTEIKCYSRVLGGTSVAGFGKRWNLSSVQTGYPLPSIKLEFHCKPARRPAPVGC